MPPILQAAVKTSGSVKSLPEIVDMKTEPKIAYLQQKGGARSTFGIIKAFLTAMNKNLHIDNTLTEDNIINIAQQLTNNDELRYWLTLADIDLLCRQIVQGRFGKFYGHFSENEFNDCLIKYCNERSELHRLQADKDVINPDSGKKNVFKPDPEVLKEVGYSMDMHGNLIVPEEKKGVNDKKPMRYLYDEKGNIKGENPAYWAKVKHKDEKTPEEMKEINLFNKKMEMAKQLMDKNPDLKLFNAIALAEIEINKSK